MVEIEVVYEGALRTQARHGPSRSALETDAPRDNMGKGERYSPTDLVAAGLGTCMLTTMGIVAAREGWRIDGTRARVEKHMVATPIRRIGRLVAEVSFPSGIPEAARAPLEHAARTCPVMQSLHADVAKDLRFEWR